MKAFILVLFLAFVAYGQQVNSTWGLKTSGDAWDGAGITYIDTTTGTTNDIVIDIDDYFFVDANPLFSDDSVIIGSSDRALVGTFYSYWDNQGTASAATDSLLYTIKAYPGIYTTDSKAVSGVKYGSAITLETIAVINDYYTELNVYLDSSIGKAIPPEVLKIELAPSGDSDCDDSTKVNWVFRYPAIYKVHKERK
jgi:hypothetical protein